MTSPFELFSSRLQSRSLAILASVAMLLAGCTGSDNKNAGAAKTVSLSGVKINDGRNGANYIVSLAGNNAGSIARRDLTLAAPGIRKTYD
ncbi:MAG: hypothetical protein WCP62_08935, partial [Planctomycetota bacterium]